MSVPSVPARLTAVLAPAAPVAVIFRHGPQKWARMIRWDMERDEFEPGQWLNAEIHGRDLSPDGTKLVYCASKFPGSERRTYTVISRPPYFTAVAFWPRESGWGMGSFLSDDHLQLCHSSDSGPPPLPDDDALRREVQRGRLRITTRSVLPLEPMTPSTVREGWHWAGVAPYAKAYSPEPFASREHGVWVKPSPNGRGTLRCEPAAVRPLGLERTTPNHAFEFVDPRWGPTTLLRGAGWADWDHRGRLVFARDGKLFAVDPAIPSGDTRELADFGSMRPESIKAPDWATRWPERSSDARTAGAAATGGIADDCS